jgi:hypothetical protein
VGQKSRVKNGKWVVPEKIHTPEPWNSKFIPGKPWKTEKLSWV